jgi:hypothetical protein
MFRYVWKRSEVIEIVSKKLQNCFGKFCKRELGFKTLSKSTGGDPECPNGGRTPMPR